MNDRLMGFRRVLRRILIIRTHNPGWNQTALMTLGGVALMGISFLLHQFGLGEVHPTVIEIGKASFYTGIGRATMPSEADKHE